MSACQAIEIVKKDARPFAIPETKVEDITTIIAPWRDECFQRESREHMDKYLSNRPVAYLGTKGPFKSQGGK